jgi:serine protease Do
MRLLLATIAVSVGMLLLLARFRFPEEAGRPSASPAPAPLERLAARATFDELAGIMADLERRLGRTVISLGVHGGDGVTSVPAVRLTADRAVAILPADRRLVGVDGKGPPPIIARDAARDLIVVQTSSSPETVVTFPSAPATPGPRYVAVVEATARATAVRPVYIGRTNLFADPRWAEPILSVEAVQQTLSPGSAVFSLDGSFVGLADESGGTVIVIPANTLRSIVAAAPSALQGPSELPIEVEPLTDALARAAGADKGVIVSHVPASIRAETDLASGDVIQAVDGIGITTIAGFQQVAQSRGPGAQVTLSVVRRGKPTTVSISAIERGTSGSWSGVGHGAVLRSIPNIGTEVVLVQPGSPADRAGVRRGDVVVSLDSIQAPDASRIERAFANAQTGQILLLAVRRDAEHRVIALGKP